MSYNNRILIISVPKSGTHYVDAVLQELWGSDYASRCGVVIYAGAPGHEADERRLNIISRDLKSSHCVSKAMKFGYMGHWWYRPVLEDYVRKTFSKAIFVCRHPFDTAVSHVATARAGKFHTRRAFRKMNMRPSHLKYIEGFDTHHGSRKMYEERWGWLESPLFFVARYEDLLTQNKEHINSFADYLNVDAQVLQESSFKAVGQKTRTFRKGSIGEWKNVFDSELRKRYIEEFGDIVLKLGYSYDK